jgi:hypothetical protein
VTSSIEAVLFDFGGVFTGSPFHAIDKYGAGRRSRPDAARLRVPRRHRPPGPVKRGELGLGEAFTQITANATDGHPVRRRRAVQRHG